MWFSQNFQVALGMSSSYIYSFSTQVKGIYVSVIQTCNKELI